MSRRRYRCACGARNSSGSSIAKTTPENSGTQASSPRMRATRGAGASASASRITPCIASADGESLEADTRSPPRRLVGKWTIGGAPVRSSSEMVRPSASVASIETPRSPNVTSVAERSKLGSSRARSAMSTLDFPAPGSPMNAQIGPGRSASRRALRKLTTRISLSSAPATACPTYLARLRLAVAAAFDAVMELNGRRSNPQLRVESVRLSELHGRLLSDGESFSSAPGARKLTSGGARPPRCAGDRKPSHFPSRRRRGPRSGRFASC